MLASIVLPPWPHRVDGGILVLVAGLFLATVLAHRYWRAKIRLEDELEASAKDAQRVFERYREAFRAQPSPAAFVDRVSGLVMEATPGWNRVGLPAAGSSLLEGDPLLEAAWRAVPAPGPDHLPAPPMPLLLREKPFRAVFLGGASLGIVLVVPDEGGTAIN